MAVGVWTVLIAAMGLCAARLDTVNQPAALSVAIMTMISVASALSQVLFRTVKPHDSNLSTTVWSFLIPNGITFAWCCLLGSYQTPATRFVMISIMLASVAVGMIFRPLFSKVPRVETTDSNSSGRSTLPPQSISADLTPIEAEPSATETFDESASTVPFPDLNLATSLERSDTDDNSVTQWMTRSRTDHEDRIVGGVRVTFEGGQRDTTIHLAFCPPFVTAPTITCEDSDRNKLQITVAASFAFGARLLIRRSASSNHATNPDSTTESCRIGFTASAVLMKRSA